METDIIHKPLEWLSDIWLPILIIILVATFAEMVSEKMVKFFIRRAVHGKHLGRPQQPISDIKKRQDTIISLAVVSLKVAIFLILSAGIPCFSAQ